MKITRRKLLGGLAATTCCGGRSIEERGFALAVLGFQDAFYVLNSRRLSERRRVEVDFMSTWSSTGGQLVGGTVIQHSREDIAVFRVSTGAHSRSFLGLGQLGRFAYSDDEAKLAVVAKDVYRADWYLMVYQGSNRSVIAQLGPAEKLSTGPSWSIAGDILCLDWGGIIRAYSMTGEMQRFSGTNARISPSGRYVAFQPQPDCVKIAEILSGKEVCRFDNAIDNVPRWSPDEQLLLYSEPSFVPLGSFRLVVREIASGGTVVSHDLGGPSRGGNYCWVVLT